LETGKGNDALSHPLKATGVPIGPAQKPKSMLKQIAELLSAVKATASPGRLRPGTRPFAVN
jgi:hypothetical protein